MLIGKRTYILAGLAVVYALSGFATGHFDFPTTLQMVWAGLTTFTMRSAIGRA